MTIDEALVVADAQPPEDRRDYYDDPELIEAAVTLAAEVRQLRAVVEQTHALAVDLSEDWADMLCWEAADKIFKAIGEPERGRPR